MPILAAGSSQQELGYSISLITINIFGAVVNFMVVLMFLRFRRRLLRKTKNLLLFCMSIADFLVGIFGIIGGVLFHLYATGRSTVTLYKICGLLPLFGSFFMSMLSLGIITADRLVSVKFPVKYNLVMNKKKATMLIFAAWIIVTSIITVLGVLFFTVSKSTELTTRGYLLGIFFVISSMILSVTNAYLFIMLRRMAAKRAEKMNFQSAVLRPVTSGIDICNDIDKDKQVNKELTNRTEKCESSMNISTSYNGDKQEKYSVKIEGAITSLSTPKAVQKRTRRKPDNKGNSMICIWMTVFFIACWFPAAVYYVIWSITGSAPAERSILALVLCLASSNSLINPIIYFAKRKDFREFLLRTLYIRQQRTDMSEYSTTRTTKSS